MKCWFRRFRLSITIFNVFLYKFFSFSSLFFSFHITCFHTVSWLCGNSTQYTTQKILLRACSAFAWRRVQPKSIPIHSNCEKDAMNARPIWAFMIIWWAAIWHNVTHICVLVTGVIRTWIECYFMLVVDVICNVAFF